MTVSLMNENSELKETSTRRGDRVVAVFKSGVLMGYLDIMLSLYFHYGELWQKKNLSRACSAMTREGKLVRVSEGVFTVRR